MNCWDTSAVMKRHRLDDLFDLDSDDEFEEPKRKKIDPEPHLPFSGKSSKNQPFGKGKKLDKTSLTNGVIIPSSFVSESVETGSDDKSLQMINQCIQGQPYTVTERDHLDLIMEDIGTFMTDLFDVISAALSRHHYIEAMCIHKLLSLSLLWTSEKCIHRLYFLLQQDLQIQPYKPNEYFVEDLHSTVDKLNKLLRTHSKTSSSSEVDSLSISSLLPLQLSLNYLVNVLTRYVKSVSIDCNQHLIKKTTEWSFLRQIIRLIFKTSKDKILKNMNIYLLKAIEQDSYILLCLHLHGDNIQRDLIKRIAFYFEEQLRTISSLDKRISILQSIPSDLMKEVVIDVHLENEFTLHPSACNFNKTEELQGSSFSLIKFCCVHLCRIPYYCSGEVHDLSYFLFLLCTLFQSHLYLLTGGPPTLSPPIHTKFTYYIPEDFESILESIRPHVAGLVDRLSEDEVLLAQLVSSDCWTYVQLMTNLIGMFGKSDNSHM